MGYTLEESLGQLDVGNDAHWTKDGSPAVAALAALTGNEKLTRADIEAVAPTFTRQFLREYIASQGPASGSLQGALESASTIELSLEDSQKEMEAANLNLARAQQLFDTAAKRHAALIDARNKEVSTSAAQTKTISSWIESQQRQREEEGKLRTAVLESGFPINELLGIMQGSAGDVAKG